MTLPNPTLAALSDPEVQAMLDARAHMSDDEYYRQAMLEDAAFLEWLEGQRLTETEVAAAWRCWCEW